MTYLIQMLGCCIKKIRFLSHSCNVVSRDWLKFDGNQKKYCPNTTKINPVNPQVILAFISGARISAKSIFATSPQLNPHQQTHMLPRSLSHNTRCRLRYRIVKICYPGRQSWRVIRYSPTRQPPHLNDRQDANAISKDYACLAFSSTSSSKSCLVPKLS